MSKYPSIHDAYGGFGDRDNVGDQPSRTQLNQQSHNKNQYQQQPTVTKSKAKKQQQFQMDQNNKVIPTDASHAEYPVKLKCKKCHKVGMTRIQSELGTASWVWCVLLSPFVCSGVACLFIDSCRDKIHYCTRCGNVVGKKYAKVC